MRLTQCSQCEEDVMWSFGGPRVTLDDREVMTFLCIRGHSTELPKHVWPNVPETLDDPRKVALKYGLGQLSLEELKNVQDWLDAELPILLDRAEDGSANYYNGVYCPLAIAVGCPTLGLNTDQAVLDHLGKCGLEVYNTRGIAGDFYIKNRRKDLATALKEVVQLLQDP